MHRAALERAAGILGSTPSEYFCATVSPVHRSRALLCSPRLGTARTRALLHGTERTVLYDTVRHGSVRYGMVRYCVARYDMVRYDAVPYGMVRSDTQQNCTARYGAVRCGTMCYGMVWYGTVRIVWYGTVRSARWTSCPRAHVEGWSRACGKRCLFLFTPTLFWFIACVHRLIGLAIVSPFFLRFTSPKPASPCLASCYGGCCFQRRPEASIEVLRADEGLLHHQPTLCRDVSPRHRGERLLLI